MAKDRRKRLSHARAALQPGRIKPKLHADGQIPLLDSFQPLRRHDHRTNINSTARSVTRWDGTGEIREMEHGDGGDGRGGGRSTFVTLERSPARNIIHDASHIERAFPRPSLIRKIF